MSSLIMLKVKSNKPKKVKDHWYNLEYSLEDNLIDSIRSLQITNTYYDAAKMVNDYTFEILRKSDVQEKDELN